MGRRSEGRFGPPEHRGSSFGRSPRSGTGRPGSAAGQPEPLRPGAAARPVIRPGSGWDVRGLRRELDDVLRELPDVRLLPVPPARPARPERPSRPARPGVRLPERVPAGTVLEPIELHERRLQRLLVRSLTEEHDRVVWADAGDEVVVELARARVAIRDGLVLVGLPLRTDDAEAELVVPLAVGTPDRITGLQAVTPRAPEGPAGLALRWGDAAIATAWGALLDVVTELARAVGEDERGAGLQPAALLAEDGVFGVVLQAEPARPAREAGEGRVR